MGNGVWGKWGWGWGLKIYPWTGMEMKIIFANGDGRSFFKRVRGWRLHPRPRSGSLPSLLLGVMEVKLKEIERIDSTRFCQSRP